MEGGEGERLALLSLVFLFPGGSNLWITGTVCPSPCPCCRALCDAAGDAGCRSLCSTCCTSLRTPSPTGGTSLSPSARCRQDSVASFRTVGAPEEAASVRQGCGSGSHRVSETVSLT